MLVATRRGLVLALGMMSCIGTPPQLPEVPPAESDQGSTAGMASTSTAGQTSSSPGTSADSTGQASAVGSVGGPAEATGDPCVSTSEAYGPCREETCATTCLLEVSVGPVAYPLSMCVPSCEDGCTCPIPDAGDFAPACVDGQCRLDCGQHDDCPRGMACHAGLNRCMWSHAYGPCDADCLSGYCLGSADGEGVCPTVSCLDDEGAPSSELCPPPSSGSATPTCFIPMQFPDVGWCYLDCNEDDECPVGMGCLSSICMHSA